MSPSTLQTTDKLVVALIISLNAARRTVCCYPPGHPAIARAFERIIAACRPFFHARREVVFGCTTEGIIYNGDYLDTGNAIYAEFAFTLFQRGIGVLTLRSPLTVDDLRPFIDILTLNREAVLAQGGIGALWSGRSSGAISIVPVRYELFQPREVPEVTEGDRGTQKEGPVWEQFLKEVTSGSPPSRLGVAPSPAALPAFPPHRESAAGDSPGEGFPVARELDAELRDLAPDAVSAALERTLWFLLGASSAGERRSLEEAIRGICGTCLAAGRYDSVVRMIGESLAFPMSPETRESLLGVFATSIDDVIGGIRLFGKTVHPDAAAIIHLLGPACVGALLDRLAEEQEMQVRRFIIERIVEFGSDARDHLVSALTDSRWYFIRNLLVIFRELKDPSVAPSIRPLLNHPTKSVREEAMKTLLQLGDAHAQAKLMQDFQDGDRATRLRALRLCTGFPAGRVFDHLSRLAMKSGVSRGVYEERRAAVAALAESRTPEAMAVITRILDTRNLLAPRLHLKLQEFCLSALEKSFGDSPQRPLTAGFAVKGGHRAVKGAT